jgi:hypothetical protein
MGNNLIVMYSSLKSLNGDILKIHNALKEMPNYARFPILWIVNRDIEKNSTAEAIKINENELI